MLLFREPLTADVRDFLNNNALTQFSYKDLGCTKGRSIPGFNTDRSRIRLGSGDIIFERAKRALRDWRMFSIEWVRLCWPYKKLVPGTVVAVQAHHYGFYSLNAVKILYTTDEPKRFGFAYGTLTDHLARGEELFVVYQEDDGTVYYELTAISRPHHWLLWLFYPLTRKRQARFVADSMQAMLEAMVADIPARTSNSFNEPA